MSVCLLKLKDSDEFDIEVWAPDYDKSKIWLTQDIEDTGDDWQRIDFTRSQLEQFKALLNELLP